MAVLKVVPIDKPKVGGTGSKKPTFGYIYLDPNTHETYRIGFAVYEELLKDLDTNVIPTTMAAQGFTPDTTELLDILKVIKEHFKEKEKQAEQLQYVVDLFDIEFPVQRRILNNYPFTRISMLNEDQLAFVNDILGISLEYVTYEAAMKRIFNKENMEPIFRSLGVNTAPDYIWNGEKKKSSKVNVLELFNYLEQEGEGQ